MKLNALVVGSVLLVGCGQDIVTPSGETDAASSGGPTTGGPPDATSTGVTASTQAVTTEDTTSASSGRPTGSSDETGPSPTSRGTSSSSSAGGTDDESSGSSGTAGVITVQTAAPDIPVLVNRPDGSLIDWTYSDEEGRAVFDAASVDSVTTLEQSQWSTIAGVGPGDELDLRWREGPDTTVLGQVTVNLPPAQVHPDPLEPGFSLVSLGCGESFGGAPAGVTSVTLDVLPGCVTAGGTVNVIAYAQGGPSIAVLGYAFAADVAWEEGEIVEVSFADWNETLPEFLFSTTDPIADPVFNTVHTQWIDGVEFPMPRRSGVGNTRLYPVPAAAEFIQFTGSVDLADGEARMFFGQRVAYAPSGFDVPVSSLLLPAITGSAAVKVDGRWELSIAGPGSFAEGDAVLFQTRWPGGFWAVMTPANGLSVPLPDVPPALADAAPGEDDVLDTPFAVLAEVDAYDGYAEFRAHGAYFFSGPTVLPDVDESLVRGTIYFPFPF